MRGSFLKNPAGIIVLVFLLTWSNFASAQMWKRYRKDVFFGVGATNFLGELGGANGTGSIFAKDLELLSTRPAVAAGFRYSLGSLTKARAAFHYGILNGNDNLTNEPFRNNRNLHFRSGLAELSVGIEQFFNHESSGHRYPHGCHQAGYLAVDGMHQEERNATKAQGQPKQS